MDIVTSLLYPGLPQRSWFDDIQWTKLFVRRTCQFVAMCRTNPFQPTGSKDNIPSPPTSRSRKSLGLDIFTPFPHLILYIWLPLGVRLWYSTLFKSPNIRVLTRTWAEIKFTAGNNRTALFGSLNKSRRKITLQTRIHHLQHLTRYFHSHLPSRLFANRCRPVHYRRLLPTELTITRFN